jgi:hypothetical protein
MSIFPEYIKFELCEDLIKTINDCIYPYKNNTLDASIYSLDLNKTIKSDRRVSKKSSFDDDKLKDIIQSSIYPLLYDKLSTSHPIASYNIALSTSKFDYIKYDNGGYFEPHKDFIKINNPSQQQYTMLLGLTKDGNNYSGCTVLWSKVTESSQSDYDILLNGPITDPLFHEVTSKYNLPKNLESIKKILDLNKSNLPYIPHRINCMNMGKALLFKSDIIHSGEEFYSWYNPKELFMCIINITGVENKFIPIYNPSTNIDNQLDTNSYKINTWLNDKNSRIIMFDQFEMFMLKFSKHYRLIPFQIIVSSGEYNKKTFNDTYLRFLNLSSEPVLNQDDLNQDLLININQTLDEIYTKTKTKLNTRGRESHINSEVLSSTSNNTKVLNLNKVYFDLRHITEISVDNIIHIKNYFLNFSLTNNGIITHQEKINNTWEESSCNDDGDEYDEIAYLNCNIDIKFCFLK